MVKCFSADDERPGTRLQPLTDCPAADTFGAFADEIGPEGFQFLYQRMKAGHEDGRWGGCGGSFKVGAGRLAAARCVGSVGVRGAGWSVGGGG